MHKRKTIVEHPYGTIKRQWGFNYIMTKKTMERASADVGFMLIAYNLKRLVNIMGNNELKKYLKHVLSTFLVKTAQIKLKLSILCHAFFKTNIDGYILIRPNYALF